MKLHGRWFLILLLCLAASCSKKKEVEELTPLSTPSGKIAAPPEEKKEEPPKYAYPHSAQRDPFIPLVGGAGPGGGLSGGGMITAQDLLNLELKGILQDRRGKIAVITSSDGESYTLRAGKIYDKKNRIISGVSGIIKENSVVIVTSNKIVKELTLKKIE